MFCCNTQGLTRGLSGELDLLQKQALIEPLAFKMQELRTKTADKAWLAGVLREQLPGIALNADIANTLIESIQAKGGKESERVPAHSHSLT